jgi:hypothetical protein
MPSSVYRINVEKRRLGKQIVIYHYNQNKEDKNSHDPSPVCGKKLTVLDECQSIQRYFVVFLDPLR